MHDGGMHRGMAHGLEVRFFLSFFLLQAFIPGPAYSLQAGRREKANDKRDRSSRMDGSIPCMMEACIVAWHMGWKYVSFFLFFCYRHSFQDLLTVCKQVDGKRPMTNAIDRR